MPAPSTLRCDSLGRVLPSRRTSNVYIIRYTCNCIGIITDKLCIHCIGYSIRYYVIRSAGFIVGGCADIIYITAGFLSIYKYRFSAKVIIPSWLPTACVYWRCLSILSSYSRDNIKGYYIGEVTILALLFDWLNCDAHIVEMRISTSV